MTEPIPPPMVTEPIPPPIRPIRRGAKTTSAEARALLRELVEEVQNDELNGCCSDACVFCDGTNVNGHHSTCLAVRAAALVGIHMMITREVVREGR